MVDVTTLKIPRKPVKIQRKVQQDALGKVNRIKEIKERTVYRLTDNSILWGRKIAHILEGLVGA